MLTPSMVLELDWKLTLITILMTVGNIGFNVQANEFFLEKVSVWQRRLGAVDAVLMTWMDVQKNWQALESIFVGSADIRVQLLDDSKRFDIINANFQVCTFFINVYLLSYLSSFGVRARDHKA